MLLYLFIALEDVELAEWAGRIHFEPFHDACRMEMVVAGESVELRSILVRGQAYTALLERRRKHQKNEIETGQKRRSKIKPVLQPIAASQFPLLKLISNFLFEFFRVESIHKSE